MVNTVLGPKPANSLGKVLMHEHIIWNWNGADSSNWSYDVDEVVDIILPYLNDLKSSGCDTLVEATPHGSGRDVEVLRKCSEKSGLNIITNTGAWDGYWEGLGARENYIPACLKSMEVQEISALWEKEYMEGIGNSGIKPGFVKLAMGDEGFVSELQEKLLRAGAKTSLKTGLTIQCHVTSVTSLHRIVKVIEEEGVPLDKFIWVHADAPEDISEVLEMCRKGIWVELDCIPRNSNWDWYVEALRQLIKEDMISKVLISQDAGSYYVGESNPQEKILPYSRLFREFIPYCTARGISEGVLDEILTKNSQKALDVV